MTNAYKKLRKALTGGKPSKKPAPMPSNKKTPLKDVMKKNRK